MLSRERSRLVDAAKGGQRILLITPEGSWAATDARSHTQTLLLVVAEIEERVCIEVTILVLVILIIFVVGFVRGLRIVFSRAKVIVELVVKLD